LHDSSPLNDDSRQAPCCLFILARGYHTYFYLFPVTAFVTTFATVAEVAVVHIVLVMATAASHGYQYFLVHRLHVAGVAIAPDLLVRPVQFEIGLVVIEVPRFPIARVVASLAFRTQLALMRVFFFVARPAIRLGILERWFEVTFLALYQHVTPE
jgi:hypothetical protein